MPGLPVRMGTVVARSRSGVEFTPRYKTKEAVRPRLDEQESLPPVSDGAVLE